MLDERTEVVVPRRGVVDRIEGWLFTSSPYFLIFVGLGVSVLLFGVEHSRDMWGFNNVIADPYTYNPTVSPLHYQTPIGAIVMHELGARTPAAYVAVHLTTVVLILAVCVASVRWWVSDAASRLFVLAFFASPQANLTVTSVPQLDIITIGCATVMFVGPGWAFFAAGMLAGFNHFEQGFIIGVACVALRVLVRHESRRLLVGLVGLIIGKLTLLLYLSAHNLPRNLERVGLVDDYATSIVMGWRFHLPELVFSVFNVMWIAVIWMLRDMPIRERQIVIATIVGVGLPVLLTADLTRVYSLVAWPIVMLLVVYAAEHHDRQLVSRWAVYLTLLALVVPRVIVTHIDMYGSTWDRVTWERGGWRM